MVIRVPIIVDGNTMEISKEELWKALQMPDIGTRTCRNCEFLLSGAKCGHETQGTSKVLINEKCRYLGEVPRLWVWDGKK